MKNLSQLMVPMRRSKTLCSKFCNPLNKHSWPHAQISISKTFFCLRIFSIFKFSFQTLILEKEKLNQKLVLFNFLLIIK